MKIHGLQKLTLLDYPQKTACTVFLGGCNFRCPFCHNRELVLGDFPQELSEEEIIAFLKKRIGILEGVCITGGEPLLNEDIAEFIKKIRDIGYLVKLDTNGSNPELLKKLVNSGLINYVAMDIKNSKKMYPETVGINNFDLSGVEESVEFLKSAGIEYEFRTTIVSEYHSKESITELAEWISGAKKYFLQNFIDSGNLIKPGLSPVSKDELKGFLNICKKYVEHADIRGI